MKTIEVEDSFMAYREAGAGDTTIVFLHGNPTSSYLWRKVIPELADRARCLAPDLIGMGDSGKPDIGYRLADHARYLDAWFDALGLDEVVIVGQDWGGALGMDWARRHPGRARGLALVETFLRPLAWAELPELGQQLFRRMRSAEGEQMVLRDNQFIEFNLPHGVASGLAPADHDVYRAPYPDERSRRPLLAWPREIPFDGEPADVHDRVVAYGRWMAETPEVRKLVMTVEPGVGMGSPETAAWAKETFAAVTLVSLGPGGHQAPEDQPVAMGRAIASWLWS
ncbi:haloalkane dehalogenase [Kutzneria kofuensis]|uniref:Haloalkane dehalogenase n=1 Tax=Kutzneria kofuensis TaxID=103725 RepID=A0A7W9KT71_9PSEU|nr:haloalkane dehalogenase [Kutzneria kofuensis]MBB5897499.1 haloalkane dehalogenase [Kutzneria kofuensis]